MTRTKPEKTAHVKDSPRANAFDKIAGREADETLANRDVFESQQLDRSRIQARQGKGWRVSVAIVLGSLSLLLVWLVWSLVGWGAAALGPLLEGHGIPAGQGGGAGFLAALLALGLWKVLAAFGVGLLVYAGVRTALMRNLDSQNLMNDTTDINQYAGDQHLALPDEIVRKFDWFPDAGAHSAVQPNSLISHVMLSNKGLSAVRVQRKAPRDMVGEDGEFEYRKGEPILDENGDPVFDTLPMIDEAFGEALFEASDLPDDKKLRKRFVATKIPYNPGGKNRDKLGAFDTAADLINDDWEFPPYEVQRPAGAYLVDTDPVNTMCLAITRAGKGQTFIEPLLDMWLREKRPNNMVVNDPKGELLVKNYVKATLRGFQVVQFNLMNSTKTDIYNPLGMAADAAREGDVIKCAAYVNNIAEVFFPLDSGDDPFWNNSANNAFKRVAFGLIDFYMEEERRLRAQAEREDMLPKTLEARIDEMWGKVTLYNCYQMFVQLTSKKRKSPLTALDADKKAGKYGDETEGTFDSEQYANDRDAAEAREFLWNGAAETDLLSLYFNATETLPVNTIRTLIMNANNSLKSMGGAEKTLATVYGIALTAMSFFTDPTIMRLTSGTPSQNTDLGGLSFPRRMGVRFAPDYLKREHLVGLQAKWEAYADQDFRENLGEDFRHQDIVSPEGWARYYFAGIFAQPTAFLSLELVHPQTGLTVKRFRFRFTKDFQASLDGRYFVADPVTGEKLVKNGVLDELIPSGKGDGVYSHGHTMFSRSGLEYENGSGELREAAGQARAISQTMVRYSEKPKAVFLVTPPHLSSYSKLLLILIKQLVDLNFESSYMTKSSQKPLYKTRFMLDELGNLQSEGHGISGFETMLSIGLGQDQFFVLILQTLQQLRAVYGESVDKIVQGNVADIVFLKSTDDTMIDTLQKMSGTRHVVYRDSKTVTKDVQKLVKLGSVEGKVSYTMTAKEEPVVSYNDMAFISPRNSIVFRAGDAPIWNRNETILPMSYRLNKDTLVHPGHEYSLQTLPTLSSAADYDARLNQPDFFSMLEDRIAQAVLAPETKVKYQKAFGYDDGQMARLDPDVYSEAVMALVDDQIAQSRGVEGVPDSWEGGSHEDELNEEVFAELSKAREEADERDRKRYAEGLISRADLGHALDTHVADAYDACLPAMQSCGLFGVGADGSLLSRDGNAVYIEATGQSAGEPVPAAVSDPQSRSYQDEPDAAEQFVNAAVGRWAPTDAFYSYLRSLASWQQIADGQFDHWMAEFWRKQEGASLSDN